MLSKHKCPSFSMTSCQTGTILLVLNNSRIGSYLILVPKIKQRRSKNNQVLRPVMRTKRADVWIHIGSSKSPEAKVSTPSTKKHTDRSHG